MPFFLLSILFFFRVIYESKAQQVYYPQTVVNIYQEKFFINGVPTLEGKTWRGYNIEGLLPNARLVQGIFDDLNPETRKLWKYPDTGQWDAERNNLEFVDAMSSWHKNGLLAFTINLQGGSPMGYSKEQPWHNSALDENGDLRKPYMDRLDRILKKADELGMVVILGIFYFGQDQRLKDEKAIIAAVDNTIDWLFEKGYRNVLIEISNECDNRAYDHEILKPHRIHELIDRAKYRQKSGYRFLVSTSFNGGSIPTDNVIRSSDFVLIHGNGVGSPAGLNNMANIIRNKDVYRPMPIVNNEDDHFDFDQPMNHFIASISSYVSWGYFDYRMENEGFNDGFQSVPVNWNISSERKRGFFYLLREMTGGND
ncbi:MAG: hypothetical protein JJU28_23560 [Cyclobacteriaceae bacterium]|nr:hypothetical protein [Cyclobacteriaceae bacterium]